jgi:hypothetical protein
LKDLIFLSYSHKDKRWRDDFDTHLKPYLRDDSIRSWSDQQITPGLQWFGEIQSALASCKVAVLLVSPDFLASDFIHGHELGPLLKEAAHGGVRILWVHIRACSYKKTALKDYQAILDPSKPLADMTKAQRDRGWVKICEAIETAVNPANDLRAIGPPAQATKADATMVPKTREENHLPLPQFFLGQVFTSLDESITTARKEKRPIFAVIYDSKHHSHSKLNYSLGYFLEYEMTKNLVRGNFVQALLDVHSPGVRQYVPSDNPLENCLLVVFLPDSTIIRREGVYANPDEGLSRTRNILQSLR